MSIANDGSTFNPQFNMLLSKWNAHKQHQHQNLRDAES